MVIPLCEMHAGSTGHVRIKQAPPILVVNPDQCHLTLIEQPRIWQILLLWPPMPAIVLLCRTVRFMSGPKWSLQGKCRMSTLLSDCNVTSPLLMRPLWRSETSYHCLQMHMAGCCSSPLCHLHPSVNQQTRLAGCRPAPLQWLRCLAHQQWASSVPSRNLASPR